MTPFDSNSGMRQYKNMKKYIVLLILFSTFLSLFAESIISDIQIEGLKRTKEETVLRIIQLRPGDTWTEDYDQKIEQRLRQSGIFQQDFSIETRQQGNEVELLLQLQDKWTLLAIPFFTVSQGKSSGGAFVLDSNAFGKKHLIVTSVMFGNDAGGLFMMYQVPNIGGSNFNLLQTFVYNQNDELYTDITGKTKQISFSTQSIGAGISISGQWKDRWSAGISPSLYYISLSDRSNAMEDEEYWSVPIRLQYSWSNMYLFPLFQQGISLSGETQVSLGKYIYPEQEITATFSLVPVEWIQLQSYGRYKITGGEISSYVQLGKERSSKSLPDDQIAASSIISGEASAEFRIIPFSFGSLTLPMFYEIGLFKGYDDESIFYHGAGGGLRLYIDKVAVPAMGLEYHQNFNGAGGNLTFSIGMSF